MKFEIDDKTGMIIDLNPIPDYQHADSFVSMQKLHLEQILQAYKKTKEELRNKQIQDSNNHFDPNMICQHTKDEQKIEQNQEKSEICSDEECDGVLKWSTRFRESQQKLTQLKKELKSAVTLLDNTSSTGGKLKSKLDKINKLVKELENDYEEIVLVKFVTKLKKLLEEKLQ